MAHPILSVQILHESASLPAYQTDQAAGLDLAACLPAGTMRVEPGAIAIVPTGIAVAIPAGYEGQVRPRSGLATKYGLTVVNAPGTIDADYRGEVRVGLINLGTEAFEITHGLRIAQLVISPVARASIALASSLDATARGRGGFGSTGLA